MATLDATVGGVSSNSYATLAEATLYYEMRTPVDGWDNADDQNILLMMATRVLDALAMPMRTYVPPQGGQPGYYITRRSWAGSPATLSQKLAWPRLGLYDMNGRPLNFTITSISVAAAAVVTTSGPHYLTSGQRVLIDGSNSTPILDGERVVTVLTPTTFSVPLLTTGAGTAGSVFVIPQALKDAQAELAGALGTTDTTLDNDVIVQGLKSVKAGSVSLTFKDMIERHVLPDMVWNLMPPSWFTEEIIEQVWPAQFDVVSE